MRLLLFAPDIVVCIKAETVAAILFQEPKPSSDARNPLRLVGLRMLKAMLN